MYIIYNMQIKRTRKKVRSVTLFAFHLTQYQLIKYVHVPCMYIAHSILSNVIERLEAYLLDKETNKGQTIIWLNPDTIFSLIAPSFII